MDNKALCIMYKPEQLDDEEFYFLYGLSLREIGRRLKRHHTTIIHNSRFDTIHLSDLLALLNLPGRMPGVRSSKQILRHTIFPK
jgi:hypothetical protein